MIKIQNSENGTLNVQLSDILEQIAHGHALYWSILFLDGVLHHQENISIHDLEKKINQSDTGLHISWGDLISLSKNFHQIYQITLLGLTKKNTVNRHTKKKDLQERCNILIELVDCAFWEIGCVKIYVQIPNGV